MNIKAQFCFLKKDEIQEIATIILEANRDAYPLLIHKYISLEEFQKNTLSIIQKCFKAQQKYEGILGHAIEYNYGLKLQGKLVAVMLSLDLVEEYQSMKPIINNKAHILNIYARQYANFGIESMHPGTATYFTRLSVKPEVMRKGLGRQLVYEACKYQFERGYRYVIAGSVVEPSFRLLTKLGGEVLKHIEAVMPTFTCQINIIKNDFKKLIEICEGQNK